MPNNLTVTCIEQRMELAALEEEWDELLEQSDVASPFLTPGWQIAWLDSYGTAYRPFVLVAREEGHLVGLWPLARRQRGMFRVLEPIGTGRSDWLDIPVATDRRDEVLSAFLAYLTKRRKTWDILEHRDVLADSPSIEVLETLCKFSSIHVRKQPRTISPYLTLTGTWEQFLKSKRTKFRSNLKYYRRLPGRSDQRFTIKRLAWKGEDTAVDDMAAIELRSWKAQDGNLKISTQTGREFYRRFCRYLASREWLEIWRAEINDVPVAFILNIIYQGKCYHYNTCYDNAFGYISPGVLLHAEAIADAFERKLSEYDFLSGDEPYKERWCSDRRRIEHLTLFHWRPTSIAAQAILVEARWAFRRSQTLRNARQFLLFLLRRIQRRNLEK